MLPNLMEESVRGVSDFQIENLEDSVSEFKLQKTPEEQEMISLQTDNTVLRQKIQQKDNMIQSKQSELTKMTEKYNKERKTRKSYQAKNEDLTQKLKTIDERNKYKDLNEEVKQQQFSATLK